MRVDSARADMNHSDEMRLDSPSATEPAHHGSAERAGFCMQSVTQQQKINIIATEVCHLWCEHMKKS